jgi:hypothetical protein
MTRVARACLGSLLVVLLMVAFSGCGTVDDQARREQVVELARDGQLSRAEGFDVFSLPSEFANLSDSGEVVVLNDDALTVFFYRVRGVNHYAGWAYRSDDALDADSSLLAGSEATIERLGPNWFFVDVP